MQYQLAEHTLLRGSITFYLETAVIVSCFYSRDM